MSAQDLTPDQLKATETILKLLARGYPRGGRRGRNLRWATSSQNRLNQNGWYARQADLGL